MKTNNYSLSRNLYNYFNKKWFLTTLIITAAGNWFIILECFGTSLGTVDSAGVLTSRFYWLFFPVFAFAFLFSLGKAWADHYNQRNQNNGQLVLNEILQSVTASKEAKFRRFANFIKENNGKSTSNTFHSITKPTEQIESLLGNIQVTFSNLFGIKRNGIGLSIIYSTNNYEWNWLCTLSVSEETTLNELTMNSTSAVSQLINHKESSIFYADKRKGMKEGKYFPSRTDKNNMNIGSIICRDISIGHDQKYLRAILSITTYGLQLCSENDLNAKEKINELLVHFEQRLKVELALLFMKEKIAVLCKS